MANNRRPRKPHKPTPWQIPVTIRFNSDDERTLQLVPHQELEKLRIGTADEFAENTIICRLNIGTVLAHRHFTNAEQLMMKSALDAAAAVRDRHERVGKFGAKEAEIIAIGAGLVLTDDMQLLSSRRELRDAINHVFKEAGA